MLWRGALLAALCAQAAWPADWTVAADTHFEVYSHAGPESARATLDWLERLRTWLAGATGLQPDRLRPARVIGFASSAEYVPFRPSEAADAHYVGTEARDYIVMVIAGPRANAVAAHEFAHMAVHSAGLRLPPWLGEGMADVFADAAGGVRRNSAMLGVLLRREWIPIPALLRMTAEDRDRESRDWSGLFYAESGALASMLMFSPDYSGKLRAFVAALTAGATGEEALAAVYGKTAGQLTTDLRAWVERGPGIPKIEMPAGGAVSATVEDVPPQRVRLLLATMLLESGELGRAAAVYRELPENDPDVQAGLGVLAFADGDRAGAREHWRRAIALGVRDDALCYRYAIAVEDAGAPAAEIRAAFERAIGLRPDFDDARFRLALLEKNEQQYDAAIAQFRAMKVIAPSRAFVYWTSLSDALNSAGRFDEAEDAAKTAARHASTAEEHARAAELAYAARTEVVVQLMPDAQGHPRMVTARTPRGRAEWNPFIDPRDVVHRAEGVLREIDCSGAATRFLVETPDGRVALAIPDPARVQMRNAPGEFTCGPQPDARNVSVVYAAAEGGGILRGIEFR